MISIIFLLFFIFTECSLLTSKKLMGRLILIPSGARSPALEVVCQSFLMAEVNVSRPLVLILASSILHTVNSCCTEPFNTLNKNLYPWILLNSNLRVVSSNPLLCQYCCKLIYCILCLLHVSYLSLTSCDLIFL